ncbi:prepilin-type N-terminal cleavage/methylation domain-containing protein [Candidatus Kaiserbacteria bacterium]|nr:prepilin-type N-terminal cleavage/methylation domain-containing protein [Candidatus Kaiserbacteria bacterium]
MNLQVVFKKYRNTAGFTLVEMILVLAIMLTIGVFVSPIGISFYRSQQLNEVYDGLTSAIRQAEMFSLSGKGGQSYGVYIGDNEYILFSGESYSARIVGEDSSYYLPASVSVSGPNEIVFSQLSGEPSVTGLLTISLGNKQKVIEIMASGNISR